MAIDPRPHRRFLLNEELFAFRRALNKQPSIIRDFFYICLLTGAGQNRVLTLRWDQIDMDSGYWLMDDEGRLKLPIAAIAILSRRLETAEDRWVFRGMPKPRSRWQKLIEEAGIRHVDLHQVRVIIGSYLILSATNPYIV